MGQRLLVYKMSYISVRIMFNGNKNNFDKCLLFITLSMMNNEPRFCLQSYSFSFLTILLLVMMQNISNLPPRIKKFITSVKQLRHEVHSSYSLYLLSTTNIVHLKPYKTSYKYNCGLIS